MKTVATLLISGLLFGLPLVAAGQTCDTPVGVKNNCHAWVDTDGDGLPGPNATTAVGQAVTMHFYIDSGTYVWTNFGTWWGNGVDVPNQFFATDSIVKATVTNTLGGGTFNGLDNFSISPGFGLGGTGYTSNNSGVRRLCTVTTRGLIAAPTFSGCVTPLTDFPSATSYSLLGNIPGGTYAFFCAGTNTAGCYTITSGTPSETKSWGQVKGLFR